MPNKCKFVCLLFGIIFINFGISTKLKQFLFHHRLMKELHFCAIPTHTRPGKSKVYLPIEMIVVGMHFQLFIPNWLHRFWNGSQRPSEMMKWFNDEMDKKKKLRTKPSHFRTQSCKYFLLIKTFRWVGDHMKQCPYMLQRYLNETCNKINNLYAKVMIRSDIKMCKIFYLCDFFDHFIVFTIERSRMYELVTIRLCQYISTLKAHSISRERKRGRKKKHR